MRIGLHVSRFTWPGGPAALAPTLVAIARRAEEAGFSSLSVMDHFFQVPNAHEPDAFDLPGKEVILALARL